MRKEWRVDTEKPIAEAPVPSDLKTKYYQFQQNVLFRPIPNHPLWIKAFDARTSQEYSSSSLKWLSKPPYDQPIIDTLTREYDLDSLRAITDGWFTRRIIDKFRGRWRGIRNTDGSINRDAMAIAALKLLKRMLKLLTEVERVNEWRARLTSNIQGGNTLCGKECSSRDESECHPVTPSKKAARFAKDYRYWLYCELVLLRSELRDRYHLRHDQAISRFSKHQLSWQKCWFQQTAAPYEAIARMQSIVDGTGAGGEDSYTDNSHDDSDDENVTESSSSSSSGSSSIAYSAPPVSDTSNMHSHPQ